MTDTYDTETVESVQRYLQDQIQDTEVLRRREQDGEDTWAGSEEFYDVLSHAYHGAIDALEDLPTDDKEETGE